MRQDVRVWVIDVLDVQTWLRSLLPRWLMARVGIGRAAPAAAYVLEPSRAALALARACRVLTRVAVEPLTVQLGAVRDAQGQSVRLRVAFGDLAQVQRAVLSDPRWRPWLEECAARPRWPAFLSKALAATGVPQPGTLWRALLLVQLCAWKARQLAGLRAQGVCMLHRQPWMAALQAYAAQHRVSLVAVPPPVSLRAGARRAARWLRDGLGTLRHRLGAGRTRGRPAPLNLPGPGPRIAVESYGQLNLDQPERYSDVFFWQEGPLRSEDVVLLFSIPRDPLDEGKLSVLARHRLGAVAISPRAAAAVQAPRLIPRQMRAQGLSWPSGHGPCARWVRGPMQEYERLRACWEQVFAATGANVYVSWYKYDGTHCAIADAMQAQGGVTAMYQRAFESHPAAETTIAADIVFGFSRMVGELERRSDSRIPWFVVTGYLGDHRFRLLRETAQRVRRTLQEHGARRVLAFTDENSKAGAWWHSGHEHMRQAYGFLLERVLEEPWVGLVLKPKVPSTLRARLGPVAQLLARAEATGRCHVFAEGAMHGGYPPAAAAMAADVMVHGHLWAATAGLESALASVPTLLMDPEGWPMSPFYRLGERVVFTEWGALWRACQAHWMRPGGVPGFGDWTPLLDELDPFRDGLAAQRMGTYLGWLLEGFRAGGRRETVLAEAAERYAARWGREHVMAINMGEPDAPRAAAAPTEVGA